MPDSRGHTHTAPVTSSADERCFQLFLEGDDNAYVTLYQRYEQKVLTYLRTIMRECPDMADDLFQETFIRLYKERQRKQDKKENEYKQVQNFRGWLFRIAHNLAISHLRSRRQTVSLSDEEDTTPQHDERLMVPIEESFTQLFGTEDPLTSQDVYEKFRACVELLPSSLREVYVLREINGLGYDEVAEIVECTEEAARMRISRARRTLRKALEKHLRME